MNTMVYDLYLIPNRMHEHVFIQKQSKKKTFARYDNKLHILYRKGENPLLICVYRNPDQMKSLSHRINKVTILTPKHTYPENFMGIMETWNTLIKENRKRLG